MVGPTESDAAQDALAALQRQRPGGKRMLAAGDRRLARTKVMRSQSGERSAGNRGGDHGIQPQGKGGDSCTEGLVQVLSDLLSCRLTWEGSFFFFRQKKPNFDFRLLFLKSKFVLQLQTLTSELFSGVKVCLAIANFDL